MKSGYYSFGADGKLILPFTGVKDDGTGTLYYYIAVLLYRRFCLFRSLQ